MRKFLIKIYYVFILLFFFGKTIYAVNPDLSGIALSEIKNELRPIVDFLVNGYDAPISIFAQNSAKSVILGMKSEFMFIENNDIDYCIPAFYTGAAINQNLILGLQLGAGSFHGDNLSFYGPFISTNWGDYLKPWITNVSLITLRGPDDFRFRDINIGLGKYFRLPKFECFIGINRHITRCNVNISDSKIHVIKNLSGNFVKTGIYKNISKSIKTGLECSLSPENISLSISLTGNLARKEEK